MTEPKDFTAGVGSDIRKSQKRVLFVTRRVSAQVKSAEEEQIQTYPEGLIRAALAIEVLAIALVLISLFFNAPLEGIADPTNTPNPAKAPWYFLGLQELLHYFPPLVAGVLIPAVLVIALIVIPYFNVNVEADGVFLKHRRLRLTVFYVAAAGLSLFLLFFHVYVALIPTLVIAAFMLVATVSSPQSPQLFRRFLASKTVSWWIMTWFLFELVVLTIVGTFFRGPGWSWIWPWRS
jgi:quinol---cytochrome c reductase cytochrome c subunit, bacillus type